MSAVGNPERVSVVIPAFNRAASLPALVDSLLRQTHPVAEIVIVDDGSTDDTAAVAQALPGSVKYIHQANAGVSAARNRGIDAAAGEWIALADSDDLWEPEKLEVQLAALRLHPEVDWSVTGCTVVDGEGDPTSGRQGFERVFPVFAELGRSPEEHFSDGLTLCTVAAAGGEHRVFAGDLYPLLFHGNVALPSSALFRRGLVERTGGFDPGFRLAEETEFFHRLAAAAPAAVVTSPLVRYQQSDGDSLTSSANTPRLVENALLSLDRAIGLRSDLAPEVREAYRTGRERLLLKLAYARLSMLDGSAARDAIRRAWKAGAGRSPRALGLYVAGSLPTSALRALHAAKRAVTA